jgi:dihydroorotase
MVGSSEFILRNGTIPWQGGETVMDIHIQDGRIAAVGEGLPIDIKTESIDVAGKLVLPGIIDGHTHLREFGFSEREDYFTGTAAAAVGGITTVFDMPNNDPKVTTTDAFKERRDRVMERAYVNIGLYVWACPKNVEILDQFAPLGAIGFKIFTAESGYGDPAFKQYIAAEPQDMFRILEKTASFGGLTAIHSENQALITYLEDLAQKTMEPDMRALMFSRPNMVEDVAVFSEVAIARQTGARIHICHVVGQGTVDFIRWAKQNYHGNLTCEVTPANLLLTEEETIAMEGSIGRFSPPVHGAEHKQALWQGLLDGTIDMIGSDHAPQDIDRKLEKNVWKSAPGAPALDCWVPLMLNQVAEGNLSLARFVEATSKRPAEVFGVYPKKGSLAVGADADLVVIDMDKIWKLDPAKFMSKAKYSPFEGWPLRGLPVMTFVNGTLVAKDGEIVAEPGVGGFVLPGGEIVASDQSALA